MKKIVYSNYRVEVTPAVSKYVMDRHANNVADCRDIAKQIERHVDGCGSVDVRWDTSYECSFCGATWEVDGKHIDERPVCCKAAQKEWDVGGRDADR